MKKFIILDWAGNDSFHGKEFSNFDDADEFLTEFIEKTFPETSENEKLFFYEKEEFQILEKNQQQNRSY